jgi:hypothetical protein
VLDNTGGVLTAVESLSLPRGQWTITSTATAVNFGAGDFIRCRIDDGLNPLDGGSTTYLAGTVGDLANAATAKTSSPLTVRLACEHDADASNQIYIDPGATLLAVKGGPIQQPPGTATRLTSPSVVQGRTSGATTLTQNAPTTVTSVSLGAGTWAVRANLSAVAFGGSGWAVCELDGPTGEQGFTEVDAGHSVDLVSEIVTQAVFSLGTASAISVSCYSVYTGGMYVDAGATITATLVASPDLVAAGSGAHALTDAGATLTTVFQQKLPAGDWRMTSVSNAYARNPNGSVGGAQDFVRCSLFAGKKQIDGGATALIVSSSDSGNYEQQVLNTATHTATVAWTLKLKCLHDSSIATGSHWTISLDSPVIAIQKGPIRSRVT